jgi:hypothetical protein
MRTAPIVCYCALSLLVVPLRAAAQSPEVRAEAKQRFDRGLALFEEGDSDAALSEFKRAYELLPNSLVLYNIGLTYAGMKRPVEAADALGEVLAAPTGLTPAQLALAQSTRDDQTRRIGYVAVSTNVPASISVDSVRVGQAPLTAALRLSQGTHVVGASAPDRLPYSRQVTVAGGEQQTLSIELALSNTASAQLIVQSPLRDVQIAVDGTPAGKTPFPASIRLDPGPHTVGASRPGYVTERRELELALGASATLEFALRVDPAADSSTLGQLALQFADVPGADVTIDRELRGPYSRPLSLPAGPHSLHVSSAGFDALERDFVIVPGQQTALNLELVANADTRAAHRDAVSQQRTWGWVTGLAGLALGGAGLAVGLVAASDLEDAHGEYDAVWATFEPGSGLPCDKTGDHAVFEKNQCDARLQAAKADVDQSATWRTVGFITAGVGAAALITGVVLIVSAGDLDKYERAPSARVVALPQGAELQVHF